MNFFELKLQKVSFAKTILQEHLADTGSSEPVLRWNHEMKRKSQKPVAPKKAPVVKQNAPKKAVAAKLK